jgi:small ligand-binding sensory domain FIST
MGNDYSVAAHWSGDYDEARLQAWAEALRQQLPQSQVSLGLVFMTPKYFDHASQILELLRVHAQIPLLLGCSSQSLIVGDQEIEEAHGLVLGLYALPGARLQPFYFDQEQLEEATDPSYWHSKTGVDADQTNGWLVFADPFQLDCEAWLHSWNEAYAPRPILGGLASGDPSASATQLYLNGQVFEGGGVAVAVGGDMELASVISQGCTPIGETWTITRAQRNLIHEIGNRPAYQVLAETFNSLPPTERQKAHGNLFVGLVINEYLEEFHRGDFLIRNLIGADPQAGTLAVGALPRAGQTIQFQRRDSATSTQDITALVQRARTQLAGKPICGGCLCSCNGRGRRLFGEPNHDARHVQNGLGPLGLTGFFCNGEIGPVGARNFLHGYTAALALFVKKSSGLV